MNGEADSGESNATLTGTASAEGLLYLGYGMSHRLEAGPLERYYLDSVRVTLVRE